MRILSLIALAACSGGPPEPEPDPVCPANIVGCSAEVGFMFELYNHNPCPMGCRKWAEQDLDAAARFLCSLRRPPNDAVNGISIMQHDLNTTLDPRVTARTLQAVADNCPREKLDRFARDTKRYYDLDRDWTPVRRVAEKLILLKGGSPELYDLVREGE